MGDRSQNSAALRAHKQRTSRPRFVEPSSEVFDRPTALARFDGDVELLAEGAAIFLESCPKLVSAIRDAVERRELRALMVLAHALKGSVAHFAAGHAFEAALRLEAIGRAGDLTCVDEAYQDLEAALEDLRLVLADVGEEVLV